MVKGLNEKRELSGRRGIFKKSATIVSVVLGIALIGSLLFLTNLPAPDIKQVQPVMGAKGRAEGNALAGSTVKLYVNNAFVDSSKVNESGEFSIEFTNDTEGEIDVTTTQSILFFVSNRSSPQKSTVDLTAPKASTVKINAPPTRVTEDSTPISGTIGKDDVLLVNSEEYKPSTQGEVSSKYKLKSGINKLELRVRDAVGNTSDVVHTFTVNYDNKKTSFMSFNCSEPDAKEACLEIGQWTGYNGQNNALPIAGKVGEDIVSVTVDGKNIKWDESGVVFQRISLYLAGGINKYRVEVKDKYGGTASGYVQTTSESTYNQYNINVR